MTVVFNEDDFSDRSRQGHFTRKILVEGDSWVSHLQMDNLAVQLSKADEDDYLVLNLGDPGDNAGTVYGSSDAIFRANGPQMKKLKKLLRSTQFGEKFDLIFISAAGNDVLGPEVAQVPLVNNKRSFPGTYGRDLINLNFYARLDAIERGYKRFLRMLSRGDNRNTPVATHVYSYLQPRKVGTHFFGQQFHRGWLARHLEHQAVRDPDEQRDIIYHMLDRLHQMMAQVQQAFPQQLFVADTRRVLLRHGLPNTDWFHDEIHPSSGGFRRVFREIRRQATQANMWLT